MRIFTNTVAKLLEYIYLGGTRILQFLIQIDVI